MEFTPDQLRTVVMRLLDGLPGVLERAKNGHDEDLRLILSGIGGWSVPNVLRTAAACALAKRLSADHQDVLFIRGALGNYGFTVAA